MASKRVYWLVAMLGMLVLSTGVILAQKSDHFETERTLVHADGGHAWLGVRLNDVTPDKAREMKLPGEYGAVVARVQEDSPAAKARLEKDDVILEFAGQRVWSAAALRRMLEETPAGRNVELHVSRGGQARNLSVKLEGRGGDMLALAGPSPLVRIHPPRVEVHPMPPMDMSPFAFNFGELMGGPRLGIEAQELSSQLANYFGVKQGKGVLVGEVKSGTPAEKAGLKAGDCIVAIDGKEITSVEELRQVLRSESSEKRQHTLTIVRDRHEQTVTVEIEQVRALTEPQPVDDDLEDLEDEISALRNYGPSARLEAENSRREIEAQSRGWQEELKRQQSEIAKLRKEMASQSANEILARQLAESQQLYQNLKQHFEEQSQMRKKEWLDKQLELQKELQLQRELLDRARDAATI